MGTEAFIAMAYYSTAAKYIAVGMACLGMGFVAIAVGNIFSTYLSGALRNPSAAADQQARVLVFAAVAESLGIFLLLIAILLIFVV
ncbi:F0F1 ATP synthase subunit C [Candidatus Liberibacter americanus]|uniref:ATP synthase F(0) sector subunit c n=1 Tax=Candidatus Liberibacter americanus str. Sao Paulo TaxID=1261131 RepID=U6B482_9HYPH|nr:F0F1 ATP synthase subunit C [Candidatus Liberibacter americanus]AHA27874.1 ATP synthase C chain [Candidatus Liberibacter americanus str. Sao Paulo]EMS35917.1 H+transporting two-sector ATPase C subunit [Candidatus Liberibacter americanus PW_SP]